MMQHEKNQTQTDALAVNFPDLSREHAYAIQRLRLEQSEGAGDRHVGWKLGWTRLADPTEPLDPIVGHYTRSRVHGRGEPVSTRGFTAGTAMAEPEIVFYLDKDLPGPTVTREEVVDAIREVGIAMEFVNWRAMEPRTREHAIADNGIVAGVVLEEAAYDRSAKRATADRMADAAPLLNMATGDSELTGCDLVVEAIVENADVKRQIYARIEPQLGENVILASNTSTIPIEQLAEQLERPDKFCGIAWTMLFAGSSRPRSPLLYNKRRSRCSRSPLVTTQQRR